MFFKNRPRRTPASMNKNPSFPSLVVGRTSIQGGKSLSGRHIVRKGATAILSGVHVRLGELLVRHGDLGRQEIREKNRVFHRIREELIILLELEESLFHPVVDTRDVELTNSSLLKAQQDHNELKTLLKVLMELSSENRAVDLKMNALQQCVLRHLQREKSYLFPPSRTLPLGTLRELTSRMELRRDRQRMNQQGSQYTQCERSLIYPAPQDLSRVPEDDRDTARSLESPKDAPERHSSDFENWGSE